MCAKGVAPVHSRFPHSLHVPSPAKSMITLLSGVMVTPCKQELFGELTLPVQPVVYTGPFVFAAKLYTNTFSELDPLVSPPTTTTCWWEGTPVGRVRKTCLSTTSRRTRRGRCIRRVARAASTHRTIPACTG